MLSERGSDADALLCRCLQEIRHLHCKGAHQRPCSGKPEASVHATARCFFSLLFLHLTKDVSLSLRIFHREIGEKEVPLHLFPLFQYHTTDHPYGRPSEFHTDPGEFLAFYGASDFLPV